MRPTPDRSASSSWLSSRVAGSHEMWRRGFCGCCWTGEKRRTDLKVAPRRPGAAAANVLALQIPYWLPVNFNGSGLQTRSQSLIFFIHPPSSLFGNHEQGQGSLRHRDPTHLGGGDNTREHIVCRPRVCREQQIRANSRQLVAAGCYRRSADSLEHRHGGQRLPGPDGSARSARPGFVAAFAAAKEKAASSCGSGRGLRPRREWPRWPRYGPHQCRRPSAATCVGFHGMVQTFQSKTIGDQGSHSIQQCSAIHFDARWQNVIEIRC